MKKIIIVTNIAPTIVWLRGEIVDRLLNNGFDISIITSYDNTLNPYIDKGCKIFDVKVDRRGKNIVNDLKTLCSYILILRKEAPLCVLTYTIKPNIYAGLACRMLGISYINNITGSGSSFLENNTLMKIVTLMYKVALKKSRCIFFQNTYDMQMFDNLNIVNRGQCRLIPGSGVNLTKNSLQEYPEKTGKYKLFFIARVMRDKGIYEYIEVAKILTQKRKDVEFHIMGFCEEGYLAQVKRWEQEGVIVYHGQQMKPQEYMKEMHVLIHPSYSEGVSNVCLEAAATGRPIIASNIPGCIETFDEGISGFGFEVGNAQDLLNKIEIFLDMPHEEKAAMGIAGRSKVERLFSREIVVDAYEDEIRKILNDVRG